MIVVLPGALPKRAANMPLSGDPADGALSLATAGEGVPAPIALRAADNPPADGKEFFSEPLRIKKD